MSKSSDIDLRQDVLDELEWDPSIDARKVGVSVEDGIVRLTGSVSTYSEKLAAERIAKRVHGVVGVANDLEVKLLFERDDVDIAKAAIQAIEWGTSIPKQKVKVTVSKGWVTLEGDVEWYYQKRAAEEAVEKLAGVRGVTNNIRIVTTAIRAADVKEKIEAALKRNAELDAKKIMVETSDGKVTLRGTVRSWIERQDAENAAWAAPGVTKVVDEIRIAP